MNKQYISIMKCYVHNGIALLVTCALFFCNAAVKAQTQTLSITSISPISGAVGSTVTISGGSFTSTTQVFFGTIKASSNYNATNSKITAIVPAGASYSRITLVKPGISISQSSGFFSVAKASPCTFTDPVFDPVQVVKTGSAVSSSKLADINADGLSDLLVLGTDATLSVFINTSKSGSISFGSPTSISLIKGATPSDIAISDLNLDGMMDAVVGYSTGDEISILQGTAKDIFSTSLTNIAVGKLPASVAIGDLNNDGIMEIVTANTLSQTVAVLKSSTKGAFDYAVLSATKVTAVVSVDIGDLNADGFNDIMLADGTNSYYYPNSGKLTFDKSVALTSISANVVTAGDFDIDQNADALSSIPGGLSTYRNGTVSTSSDAKFKTTPIALAGADYNSDGILDVAALFTDKNNLISFYLNDGAGNLQSGGIYIQTGISGASSMAAGDLDGDGQADLIVSNPKGAVYVYRKSSTVIVTPGAVPAVCEGATGTVTASLNSGTLNWYDAAGKFLTAGSSYTFTAPAGTPSLTLTAKGTSGKCTTSQPVTVTVNPLPTLAPVAKNNSICAGDFATIDAGGNATTYAWTPAADVQSPASNITNITPKSAPITGSKMNNADHYNIYTYTVTGTLNGCTNTASLNINVYDPSVTIASSSDNVCSGDKTTLIVSITNADFLGSTFKWSTAPNNVNNPADGVSTAVVTPVNTTTSNILVTYSISGTSTAGCAVSASKPITVKPAPPLTPTSLPRTIVGSNTYSQAFRVTGGVNPTFSLSGNIPSGFGFSGNNFQGNPITAGTYLFTVTGSEAGKCNAQANYTFIIEDLANPNLIVSPIYKNMGDPSFHIQSISQSTGPITYTTKTATDGCVTVGADGLVNIKCRSLPDSIPILIIQDKTTQYRSAVVESYIKVSPNPHTSVELTTDGVVLDEGDSKINYNTNSDATASSIQFVQLNNPDIAKLNEDGTLTPYAQGDIQIEVRIPATNNYKAVSSMFTVTVYPELQKPVIVPDTIKLMMGHDTIVNILANDRGTTRMINAAKTDIDTENDGIQSKFFAIGVGNFLIDAYGNLNIQLFNGFIGDKKIGYTITDSAGKQSEQGYFYIKVKPLLIIPPLKANEVMTPNNDGANDGLVIGYAQLDENNSLTVLDEAGNVIYETTDYKNDCTGTNKKGDVVEAGVYFYVYEEKVSGRSLKQYVQILK